MPDFLFLLVRIPFASTFIYRFHIFRNSAQPRINTGKSRLHLKHTPYNTLYRVKSEKGNKKTELKISTPKSESSVREIPLPKFLIAKLEAIKSGSGFLINKKEKFIEPNVYSRRYKKILAELDIPYRKYHSTRHTFATRALEIGMDVKTLSEILGHSSPTVTLNLYAHSLPEHKRKEMDRLGKLYNPSN